MTEVQNQVEEVKGVMKENVAKVVANTERTEELHEKTGNA
jgi:hypothetical protein